MAEVDLHLHTTESDGRLTPAELVALADQRGLKVIAITDHDTTDGLDPAWKAAMAYPHLTVIAGIELSTDIPRNEIHILGYYIDHRDMSFQLMLQQFRESRVDRAQKMVEKLGGLGMALEWDRVKEIAGQGSIGRPHVAEAMLEKGYISYFQEAFEKYIGRNGPAYVEREKQIPEAAVQLIGAVGGAAVLAHPAQVDDLDTVLQSLKAAGLKGMEVYYAQYDEATVARLAALAKRYDLLPCGGSDYHAIGTPGEHLPGKAGPPMWVAEELRDLAMEQSYGRFG
ncbi:MAG: PHP domain-containing protein [Dehalococcoidia bacterium]|nr:PHP domain-containing protein [Dehalococcoidia bacterium]